MDEPTVPNQTNKPKETQEPRMVTGIEHRNVCCCSKEGTSCPGQINSNEQAFTVPTDCEPLRFCPTQDENEHMPFVSIFSTCILNPV